MTRKSWSGPWWVWISNCFLLFLSPRLVRSSLRRIDPVEWRGERTRRVGGAEKRLHHWRREGGVDCDHQRRSSRGTEENKRAEHRGTRLPGVIRVESIHERYLFLLESFLLIFILNQYVLTRSIDIYPSSSSSSSSFTFPPGQIERAHIFSSSHCTCTYTHDNVPAGPSR